MSGDKIIFEAAVKNGQIELSSNLYAPIEEYIAMIEASGWTIDERTDTKLVFSFESIYAGTILKAFGMI